MWGERGRRRIRRKVHEGEGREGRGRELPAPGRERMEGEAAGGGRLLGTEEGCGRKGMVLRVSRDQ
jgi:hypothetical protein